jgi:Ca2+-binding RTX toxin-like protein
MISRRLSGLLGELNPLFILIIGAIIGLGIASAACSQDATTEGSSTIISTPTKDAFGSATGFQPKNGTPIGKHPRADDQSLTQLKERPKEGIVPSRGESQDKDRENRGDSDDARDTQDKDRENRGDSDDAGDTQDNNGQGASSDKPTPTPTPTPMWPGQDIPVPLNMSWAGGDIKISMQIDTSHHMERPPSSEWAITRDCSWIRANWDDPIWNGYTKVVLTDEADGTLAEPYEGTDEDDLIDGKGGGDYINGKGGNDIICGGPGNDTIHGDGDGSKGPAGDVVFGEEGLDTLYGDEGDDLLIGGRESDYPADGTNLDIDHVWGGSGSDWIIGGPGADTLEGGSGQDFMFGGKGPDNLYGETIEGSSAAQCPTEEPCNDVIYGEFGDDQLWGGPGNDNLRGDVNGIYLIQLTLKGKQTPYWGCWQPTNATGDAGFVTVDFCLGNDNIHGNHGDDRIFDIGSQVVEGIGEPGNQLFGQEGNDDILGGKYKDAIRGGEGNDRIWGGEGPDILWGGSGLSSEGSVDVTPGAGDDELYGGAGDDNLNAAEIKVGGEGFDTCYVDDGSGNMVPDGVTGACDDGN